jgi:hypothetical protein
MSQRIYFSTEIVYLQPGLEESSSNPLRGKQIDYPRVLLIT